MAIEVDQDLRAANSFGVAARCAALARIGNRQDLEVALDYADARGLPVLALGGGSNLLFAGDFPGMLLKLCNSGIEVLERGEHSVLIQVQAGQNWHQLVRWSLKEKLYGLENLSLIPGTVGAAPIQNIGAYGVEFAEVFDSLSAFDLSSGKSLEMDAAACRFAYRSSVFKGPERDRRVILAVRLRLSRDARVNIQYQGLREELNALCPNRDPVPEEVAEAVCRIRQRKLPDQAILGNAGSFFKNPEVSAETYEQLLERFETVPGFPAGVQGRVKLPAAWLLERCGWKGRRRGDVGSYEHQPLVIVNFGHASGAEILAFAHEMQDSVAQEFAIHLEPEVRIIGASLRSS